MLDERFPGTSTVAASRLVKEAFPACRVKRQGVDRVVRVIGVQLQQSATPVLPLASVSVSSTTPLASVLPSSSASHPQLHHSVSGGSGIGVGMSLQLETLDPIIAHSTSELLLELQLKRDKRLALEQQVSELTKQLGECSASHQVAHYREGLQSEVDSAVSSALSVAHGPDTEDHFFSFTMEGIVQELQSTCPQLYTLFQQLARTQRKVVDDTGVLPLPELKGVMSLCTLLNARSAKAKGVQLLLALMLVARATNKQVQPCV